MANIPTPPGTTLPGHPEHHLDVIRDLVAFIDHWSYAQSSSCVDDVPREALFGLRRLCGIVQEHLQAAEQLLRT
jgi:hypothetical protein